MKNCFESNFSFVLWKMVPKMKTFFSDFNHFFSISLWHSILLLFKIFKEVFEIWRVIWSCFFCNRSNRKLGVSNNNNNSHNILHNLTLFYGCNFTPDLRCRWAVKHRFAENLFFFISIYSWIDCIVIFCMLIDAKIK